MEESLNTTRRCDGLGQPTSRYRTGIQLMHGPARLCNSARFRVTAAVTVAGQTQTGGAVELMIPHPLSVQWLNG